MPSECCVEYKLIQLYQKSSVWCFAFSQSHTSTFELIPAVATAQPGALVTIPSDPDALLDRLDILLASKAAGNTGVRNEIVSICDELLRQKVLSRNHYKNLMLYI